MGSSSSLPEQQAGESSGETTFFAARESTSPVVVRYSLSIIHPLDEPSVLIQRLTQRILQFSESLINHLTSSTSLNPSLTRQSTLDAHIQSRIASELARLREDEAIVRDQIEQALERENLDRERGTTSSEGEGAVGISHSVSLMRDLDELETRVNQVKAQSIKAKENVAWSKVKEDREELEKCLQYVDRHHHIALRADTAITIRQRKCETDGMSIKSKGVRSSGGRSRSCAFPSLSRSCCRELIPVDDDQAFVTSLP